jgi:hypothetical protein
MNTKFKRTEVVAIFKKLNEFREGRFNKNFTYFVFKNVKAIENEISAIQDIQNKSVPGQEYLEYESKRLEFAKEFSNKNTDGTPKTIKFSNGQEVFDISGDNIKLFNEKLDALQKEYQYHIDAYKNEVHDLKKFMEEEVEIDIMTINFNSIPEEIDFSTLDILEKFIVNE